MEKQNFCTVCKKLIIKHNYESWPRYLGKKYCSQKCCKEDMKIKKHGWFDQSNEAVRVWEDEPIRGYYED